MQKNKETKNFGAYMDRTIKLIKWKYTQAFKEANIDITTEQWVLLDSLSQKDGISQNELGNGSFKNAPTVSRIIDLLCKKGLTKREPSPNDRRKHHIFLTSKGKKTYQKVLPVVEDLRRKGWNGLTHEDYQQFIRIMDQIFSNFEES